MSNSEGRVRISVYLDPQDPKDEKILRAIDGMNRWERSRYIRDVLGRSAVRRNGKASASCDLRRIPVRATVEEPRPADDSVVVENVDRIVRGGENSSPARHREATGSIVANAPRTSVRAVAQTSAEDLSHGGVGTGREDLHVVAGESASSGREDLPLQPVRQEVEPEQDDMSLRVTSHEAVVPFADQAQAGATPSAILRHDLDLTPEEVADAVNPSPGLDPRVKMLASLFD